MQTLLFATSNDRKIKEARAACEPAGIVVEQIILDIAEIQSKDPIEVIRRKAEAAFALTTRPVVVGDTSWKIPSLNNFPGVYMKDMAEWFSPQDWIDLMQHKTDRRVCFIESIAYYDGEEMKLFSKEYWGEVLREPRGEDGNSMEKVMAFNGQTIAERRDEGGTSHAADDFIWVDVVKWLKTKRTA